MGDRASYAVVDGDELALYYGHWGGPTVPREVARGPDACLAFVRAQEPADGWLDFAYMEGGIVFDLRRRAAMAFGGPGDINYAPAVQRRFVERYGPAWAAQGWSLAWADRWGYDLVRFAGADPRVLEYPLPEPDTTVEACLELDGVADVVWVRGGEVRFGSGPVRTARLLPALLARWDELPAAPAPGGDPVDPHDLRDATAIVIDEAAQRIEVLAQLFTSFLRAHQVEDALRIAFPGWTVEVDAQAQSTPARLRARGVAIGVDDPPAPPPEPVDPAEMDALLDEIVAYAPEAEIASLEAAAQDLIATLVADSEAQGLEVVVDGRLVTRPS